MYYSFVFNISIDWFVCSFFITLTSRPLFLCVFFCVDHCHERFVSNGLRQFEVGRSVRWWWWWWSWFEGFYCRRWWRVLNWIKLNEYIFRFATTPRPISHTYRNNNKNAPFSRYYLYIILLWIKEDFFLRMKQSIGKQRSHIHIQTGVYNEWCNAATPIRNINTISLVGKSKFFTFNILHNALTSSLVAISMSIQ